ncbi:MAG: TspO/MBR family protein [Cyanobacteriota bacterium]
MPAWLSILLVMLVLLPALNPKQQEFQWFLKLRRPRWLTFERWIPLIWLLIYACFYASALICWQASRRPDLMAGYLLLLVMVQSYTLVICRSRRLRNGTLIGLLGWLCGVLLAMPVGSAAPAAGLLLVPYLLWSPVGTWVTWRMEALNP